MHALQREECHRAPSPQPVQCYSHHAATGLVESLQRKDTFEKGCMVLMTWLERGDCNKKNCIKFYYLICSVYRHVQKLVDEKNIIEDELTAVQQQRHQQCACNARQFQIVEKEFQIVSSQKVWVNFTKLQRKHIEQWKELENLFKQPNTEDLLEGKMEMSDSEDQDPPEECTQDLVTPNENSNKEDEHDLAKEAEVLPEQLQVANSELAESKKQIAALNDAYQLMQQKYLDTKLKLEEVTKEKAALENVTGATSFTEHEARLVSFIAIFLNMQPLELFVLYLPTAELSKMRKKDLPRSLP
ncbi:hypothetical protein JTE90_015154 [Oedothorax gibbosus]|uniref:Uncharacterized protein n=1 Tax=Oedothorax gibbosus TaxID=931172 RepID=A0AAV6VS68_9ARAC|nr:hypothetical protein JTE90_015154 [Oedothorax gibbosus]